MRNLLNSDQSYTGLVQKYIGSAYDHVKLVADHMDLLRLIGEAIAKGEWDKLQDLLPKLTEILAKIDWFQNTYYGKSDLEPTTRPDGTPTQNGDLYYDNTKGGLMVYDMGNWTPVGAVGNSLEVFHVDQAMLAGGGDTTLTLQGSYQPGTFNLLVFVNATFQYPITPATADGAYTEASPKTVRFPVGNLEAGDVVTVMSGNVVTTAEHVVSVQAETYQVIHAGEKVVELPGGMDYVPGIHNLEVFVDGLRQSVGREYVETDSRHVTFMQPLQQGSLVSFVRGKVLAAGAVNPSGRTLFDVLNTAGEFNTRNTNLQQDHVINLLGYHAINDGGGGFFVYDQGMPRSQANGGTIIDASVLLANQGGGTGNGCWVRQYGQYVEPQWFGQDDALVSNLPGLSAAQHGDIVTVFGFHNAGDGGGGQFYWDETRSTNLHDGGMIIDPQVGFPAVWNDVPTTRSWFTGRGPLGQNGCWVRLDQQAAALEWFGCIGDDRTDNSLAFEGLGKAIQNGHVSRLQVLAKTYLVDGNHPLVVDGMPRDILWHGYGERSIIKIGPNSAAAPFQFIECNGIHVQRISFHCTAVISKTALRTDNCSDITIEECYFHNFPGSVLFMGETAISSKPFNDIIFRDNYVEKCGTLNQPTLKITPKALSRNIRIEHNHFVLCGNTTSPDQAVIKAGIAADDLQIRSNYLDRSVGIGIWVHAYQNVLVENNQLTGHSVTGIYAKLDSHPSFMAPALEFLIIRGNVCKAAATSSQPFLRLQGMVNLAVWPAGGLVEVEDNLVIAGNGIHIQLDNLVSGIGIHRNRFQDLTDPHYALKVEGPTAAGTVGGPDQMCMSDNHIHNSAGQRSESLFLEKTKNTLIMRNVFENGGDRDIFLKDSQIGPAQLLDNIFLASNRGKTAVHTCVDIVDSGALATYVIKGNHVLEGSSGDPRSLFKIDSALPAVEISNNLLDRTANLIITPSAFKPTVDADDSVLQYQDIRHFYGTRAPTTGAYRQGDIVWNTKPTGGAAGFIGWVCTVAGTPGTWTTFGAIT